MHPTNTDPSTPNPRNLAAPVNGQAAATPDPFEGLTPPGGGGKAIQSAGPAAATRPGVPGQTAVAENQSTLPLVIGPSSDAPEQSPLKGARQRGSSPGRFGMFPVVRGIGNFLSDFKGPPQSATNKPTSRLDIFVNWVGDIARLTIEGV